MFLVIEGCPDKISADKGIVVDQFMKTTADNIYAAGDVIKSFDMLTEKSRNIAIWPLAVRQGSIAGKNMAGLAGFIHGRIFYEFSGDT